MNEERDKLNGITCECATFTDAMQCGTDVEGLGPCFNTWEGKWQLGCDLPHPRFCPWCGRALRPTR